MTILKNANDLTNMVTLHLFSCPGQLNRWPCHSLTHSLAETDFWFQSTKGCFFNWPPPLDWPPQKCFDWPPPKLSKCWNHIHFARHLGVFRSEGGPVWDSNAFLKSVTYRPTLSRFRGGPVKKTTLYETIFRQLWDNFWQLWKMLRQL